MCELKKPQVLGACGFVSFILSLKDTERQTPKYYYEYPYVADNQALAAN